MKNLPKIFIKKKVLFVIQNHFPFQFIVSEQDIDPFLNASLRNKFIFSKKADSYFHFGDLMETLSYFKKVSKKRYI